MAMHTMALKPVDRVEITSVLDNAVDLLLPSTAAVHRFPLRDRDLARRVLVAEHGFAALVKVDTPEHSETMLFDAGLSRDGLTHNLGVLDVRPAEIHAIALSHGHIDHTQGLAGLVKKLGVRRMPLLLHPDALLERKVAFPDGHELNLPPPDSRVLHHEGIELIEETQPSYLLGGLVMITGQIHRSTEFETGFPLHWARRRKKWEPDPMIHDDQAVVVNLRDEGLVILTGCGHAGVINTIRHAQALTGIDRVHSVIGGFHLSGALFEPLIEPTVAALKQIAPSMVVPAHCTGWRAAHALARELPDAFVTNSVGTRFTL